MDYYDARDTNISNPSGFVKVETWDADTVTAALFSGGINSFCCSK